VTWKHYCDEKNWHEAAKLFPLLTAQDSADLADDIAKHGLHNPIILFGGKVLDGRNRLLACKVARTL
jgi:ParB-like chromosome segregation protein Spo0J